MTVDRLKLHVIKRPVVHRSLVYEWRFLQHSHLRTARGRVSHRACSDFFIFYCVIPSLVLPAESTAALFSALRLC